MWYRLAAPWYLTDEIDELRDDIRELRKDLDELGGKVDDDVENLDRNYVEGDEMDRLYATEQYVDDTEAELRKDFNALVKRVDALRNEVRM